MRVIDIDDQEAADYYLFQEQHPNTYRYIEDRITKAIDTASGHAKSFMDGARDIYERIRSSVSMKLARAAVNSMKRTSRENIIHICKDLEEVRQSSALMQRYIMAQPLVRKSYVKQMIDGYSETYSPSITKINNRTYKDLTDEEIPEYRAVMDGVLFEEETFEDSDTERANPVVGLKHRHYYDSLDEDNRLQPDQQFMVIQSWEIAELAMLKLLDPTDPLKTDK